MTRYALWAALFSAALQAISFAGFLRPSNRAGFCESRLLVLAVWEVYSRTFAHRGGDGWRELSFLKRARA